MLRQAELDARTIVSESETIQLARQKSSEIIRRAEDRSKELYHVANTYTEDALRRTEEAIQAALTEVQESRARFRAASKEQMQRQGPAPAAEQPAAKKAATASSKPAALFHRKATGGALAAVSGGSFCGKSIKST